MAKLLASTILEDKGMMKFLPALICLITVDFLENLSIDKWHVGDQLATAIYPAVSDGQIITLLYSCSYLVDLKGKVARQEVFLTKLLKLRARIFSG